MQIELKALLIHVSQIIITTNMYKNCPERRLGKRRKDTDSSLNQAYEFLESDMKHGVKKTILVQLWGCEKWALDYVPKARDMRIDLAKKG